MAAESQTGSENAPCFQDSAPYWVNYWVTIIYWWGNDWVRGVILDTANNSCSQRSLYYGNCHVALCESVLWCFCNHDDWISKQATMLVLVFQFAIVWPQQGFVRSKVIKSLCRWTGEVCFSLIMKSSIVCRLTSHDVHHVLWMSCTI